MTRYTIHGWTVIESGANDALKLFTVPGTDRKMRLDRECGPYLVAFAAEYHKVIAPIDKGTFDDWAWSPPRTGRASSSMSDHCAGMAIDLNATKEGSQGSGSLKFWKQPITVARLKLLRRKFKLLEWGGDYSAKNRDPMHWTPKHGVTRRMILAEMKRLRIGPNGYVKPA